MEKTILAVVLTALLTYLLGSISSAILVSKIYAKEDIRNYGSGNAGMTNILRTFGKIPAAFTLLGDLSKGVLAVVLGRLIFHWMGVTLFDGGYMAGFFAILGHLFPVYFGFRGGKGVLTSTGAVLVINPIACLLIAVIVVPVMFLTRIVSLGSILAAVLFPIVTVIQGKRSWDVLFALLIAAVVIFMHRSNIKRLLNGTESRFGEKKKEE